MLTSQNPTALRVAWLDTLPAPARGPRRLDLDALRGVAMVLVVIGHAVAREVPAGNDWYQVLKTLIYTFHMQLFMVLSGMTFGMSVPAFQNWSEARGYSWRKAFRLGALYISFGALILAGKMLVGPLLSVDKPAQDVWSELVLLVVQPWKSAAGFLWFIYVLAVYLTVLPSILLLLKRRPIALFGVAIALSVLPWPQWFMLDRLMGYLPFFCGGIVLCLRREWWSPIPAALGWGALAVFAVMLATFLPLRPPEWLLGALSVPALLTVVQRVHDPLRRFLAMVGGYSMSIYLMNTIVIGVVKGLMLKVHGWDGPAFLVFFPVLVLAGCALPIVVKRLADRRAPALARYL